MAKYSLFHYKYKGVGTSWYQPVVGNVGDFIQSLAAKQYLPRVDKYIDRDNLQEADSDEIFIANGWYLLHEKMHQIKSDNCQVLPISIHINNQNDLNTPKNLKLFNKYGSVGCRDMATMHYLQKAGIDAYFSGCLTLTLSKNYSRNENTNNSICLVDLPSQLVLASELNTGIGNLPLNVSIDVRHILQRILKNNYMQTQILSWHQESLDVKTFKQKEGFDLAEKTLQQISKASLVITSRLHVALPCLALNVPVILLRQNKDSRFTGYESFLNHIWIENNQLDIQIDTVKGMVVNNNEHLVLAKSLRERCEEFINKTLNT